MNCFTSGSTVKVTRNASAARTKSPTVFDRNSVCQISCQLGIRLRCEGGLFGCVHAELLQLTGEGVAPPAQELRGVLPMTLCALERGSNQHALEFGLRVGEQWALADHGLAIGPARERLGPVDFRRGRRARGHFR